jgi:hypothetical protein
MGAPFTEDNMNEQKRTAGRRRVLDAGPHQVLLDGYGRHLAGIGFAPVSMDIHLGSARHFLAWLWKSSIRLEDAGPDIVGALRPTNADATVRHDPSGITMSTALTASCGTLRPRAMCRRGRWSSSRR